MKFISFIFLQLIFLSFLSAQVCTPDDTFNNEITGIYPINMGGQIVYDASNGVEFETKFTISNLYVGIPDGIVIPLDYIKILDVLGLPNGLDYECNADDCNVLFDEFSCFIVKGIPDDEPGLYEVNFVVEFPFTTPAIVDTFPSYYNGNSTYFINLDGIPDALVETENIEELSIFPNPFNDKITIRNGTFQTAKGQFLLYDILGQIVFDDEILLELHQENVEILLPGIKAGNYFYSIEVSGKTYKGKVIKI